jgi:hypothetical protein
MRMIIRLGRVPDAKGENFAIRFQEGRLRLVYRGRHE